MSCRCRTSFRGDVVRGRGYDPRVSVGAQWRAVEVQVYRAGIGRLPDSGRKATRRERDFFGRDN